MKNFKSGTIVNQDHYKAFIPNFIHCDWQLDDMNVIKLLSTADRLLGKLDMYSEYVNTACMNIHRSIPDSDNTFGISQQPVNQLLTKVIQLLNEDNYTYNVKQAAVWIVTDGANYNSMGILRNQFNQRTISLEDYQKAVSIVNRARKLK